MPSLLSLATFIVLSLTAVSASNNGAPYLDATTAWNRYCANNPYFEPKSCSGTCPELTVYTHGLTYASKPSTFISEIQNGNCPRGNYCVCLENCKNSVAGCNFVLAGCAAGPVG